MIKKDAFVGVEIKWESLAAYHWLPSITKKIAIVSHNGTVFHATDKHGAITKIEGLDRYGLRYLFDYVD